MRCLRSLALVVVATCAFSLTGCIGGDDLPTMPSNDDGTPDQGSGDAPGTGGSGGSGDDDGTPDQGSGDP